MTRDLKPTREAIWGAVEAFGSIAHLAIAMGVSRDQLQSWLAGTSEMPLHLYELMLDVIASQKAKRH